MHTNITDTYREGRLPRMGLPPPKVSKDRSGFVAIYQAMNSFNILTWSFQLHAIPEVKQDQPKVILRQLSRPYMIQIVLNLAQGCLRDFDVAGFPLVLTKLPQWSHVVHSMAEGVVVLVHQAKALQRRRQTMLSGARLLHIKCWYIEHVGPTCLIKLIPYPISQIHHFLL